MRPVKLIFSSIITILFSFRGVAQKNQIDSTEFFNTDNFLSDTLYIKSRFMECGEWGGHLEMSKIFLKENDFYISYQKFSADCGKIKENNGQPPQSLEKSVTKQLLDRDKLLIRRYIHQMVDAKLREPAPTHAGYIFEITKSDNSINIHVYTWGVTTRNEYLEFISQLIE